MNRFRNPARVLPFAIAATLSAGIVSPAVAQIEVDVNGRQVSFGNVGPQRIDGRVLIPLRAVVEALGAEVIWNAATQTVEGRKGERQFSLPIGSRTATVNRDRVDLDVPAQLIRGNTMVPLRFVAEALGAEVGWNAATQRVAISNGGNPDSGDRDTGSNQGNRGNRTPREQEEPRGQGPRDANGVFGELVAIRSRGNRSTLTLQTRAGREAYELPRGVEISRATGRQQSAQITVADLKVGDRIRLTQDADGTVTQVYARSARTTATGTAPVRGMVNGEVVAVRSNANPPTLSVMVNGKRVTLDVTRETDIYRSPGAGQRAVRANLDDIQPGDDVRIRTDSTGTIAISIDVDIAR